MFYVFIWIPYNMVWRIIDDKNRLLVFCLH